MTKNIVQYRQEISSEQWMENIKACKASSMPIKEWCQANNLTCSQYYYWQRKLFDKAVAATEPRMPEFAEISVTQTQIATCTKQEPEIIAEVEVNGINARIYSNAKAKINVYFTCGYVNMAAFIV